MEPWMNMVMTGIFIIIGLVLLRFMFKIGLVVLLIGLVFFFASGGNVQDLWSFGKEKAQEQLATVVKEEIQSAELVTKGNGEFEMASKSFHVSGNLTTGNAVVSYKKWSFDVSLQEPGVGQLIRSEIEKRLEPAKTTSPPAE